MASSQAKSTRPQGDGRGVRGHALRGKRGEQFVFALLAVLIWPVIAVGVVGGYGFLVWMYQLLTGPPGPPGG
jgi:nitrate reductase NapE